MSGRFELTSASHLEPGRTFPPGWRPRVYQLGPGRMRAVRKHAEIAPGLSVEELRLFAGSIRVHDVFDPGALKIAFFETPDMRVLGNRVCNAFVGVAYGGARFDSAGSAPGVATVVSFSEATARRVVPDAAAPRLLERLSGPLGLETLIYPLTPQASALREKLRRLLSPIDGGIDSPEDIIATSAKLIGQILSARLLIPALSAGRRRELALAVEELLWEPPAANGAHKLSLDDAAKRLNSSRRSIQLALQEEFGLGYVALKRAIRLQQAQAALKRAPKLGVGEVARIHEFFHLSRFSKHYRDMFGFLPSTAPDDAPAGG